MSDIYEITRTLTPSTCAACGGAISEHALIVSSTDGTRGVDEHVACVSARGRLAFEEAWECGASGVVLT